MLRVYGDATGAYAQTLQDLQRCEHGFPEKYRALLVRRARQPVKHGIALA